MNRDPALRVAVLMSRFPKLSETFILEEMLELEREGIAVEVFPLLRQRETIVHPAAVALDRRAHHMRLLSREVLAAQLWWLRRKPGTYLRTWWRSVSGNRHSPKFFGRALYAVPKAAAFARRMLGLHVDHIHAHYATHPALAAWVASQLTGIEYSFTAHAHDLYVERPMLTEKLEGAHFVRTISEYNRRFLVRRYGENATTKVRVIRCGVDLRRFQPRPPSSGNGERPFTLICVASLEPYKGHRYLLEALARVTSDGLNVRCLLVGHGELREAIERQRDRLGLGTSVSVCGAQPADRVRELLEAADAAVLPSVITASGKMEGVPVALMEAMAVGLPVVATNISGVGELIEHGRSGLLVPERDPGALAEAITVIVRDPSLRGRLAAHGRERVCGEFDLRRNVARLRESMTGRPAGATAQRAAATSGRTE
jgi:glycosyltransferase involved in cell wall biosynthesis